MKWFLLQIAALFADLQWRKYEQLKMRIQDSGTLHDDVSNIFYSFLFVDPFFITSRKQATKLVSCFHPIANISTLVSLRAKSTEIYRHLFRFQSNLKKPLFARRSTVCAGLYHTHPYKGHREAFLEHNEKLVLSLSPSLSLSLSLSHTHTHTHTTFETQVCKSNYNVNCKLTALCRR